MNIVLNIDSPRVMIGLVHLQEKLEQRRQIHQQPPGGKSVPGPSPAAGGAGGPTPGPESGLLTDADFEKLRVDVLSDPLHKPGAGPPLPPGHMMPQPARLMSPQMESGPRYAKCILLT